MKAPLDCKTIDEMLAGGIESGCLTLIYGEGGSGKTNFVLQLARNIAREKKVLFIDTEGVSIERLKQISGDEYEEILKNILFSEPYTSKEQQKIVEKAANLAEKNKDVGAIIVDSATTYYRLTRLQDEFRERRNLADQVTRLLKVTRTRDIPVVLTSQVYTDLQTGSFEPLGGHMLSHNAKTIISLEKVETHQRRVVLKKHRHLAEGRVALFSLTDKGMEC
ncbi:MAG: DNA repair and recombination protein RadB [Thermoplasmata archaeon]